MSDTSLTEKKKQSIRKVKSFRKELRKDKLPADDQFKSLIKLVQKLSGLHKSK